MSEEAGQALTIPKVETLKAELESRRRHRLEQKIGSYPRKNPILSDLGDCNRQIAYGVTNWQDKPPVTPELQARFEVGNYVEREMIRELLEMGFDFQGGQKAITIKGKGGILLATGKIDGFIRYQGELIPVEFKSMHPNIFEQVDTIEDFQKKPWLRKYTRQLMMYLFGENKEYGLFGIHNCLGAVKWFILYLDLGECEHLLQRLELVAGKMTAGELPDRIEYRDDICGKCDFAQICLPDIMRSEAEILTDEVLISSLEKREGLKSAHSEYTKLDKEVKKSLAGIKKGVAGNFMIVGKEMHRDGYTVEETNYFQTSIKKLGPSSSID